MNVGEVVEFPAGLAQMPPGPELDAVLERLYPHRGSFTHEQSCVLSAASDRQLARSRARALGFWLDTATREAGSGDLAHGEKPSRSGEALLAVVLERSDAGARFLAREAFEVHVRLPHLGQAMFAGRCNDTAARAHAEATREMPDDVARHVSATVLGEGQAKTAPKIQDESLRVGHACDPTLMRRIHQAAIAKRRVRSRRNRDGSADLTAKNIPPEHAAQMQGSVDHLAALALRDGDPRSLGMLQELIAHALLCRCWQGLSDAEILTEIRKTRPADPPGDTDPDDTGPDDTTPPGPDAPPDDGNDGDHSGDGDGGGGDGDGDNERGVDEGRSASRGHEEPDAARGTPADPAPGPSARPRLPEPAHPGLGIDLRVDLRTLLGTHQHPGELAGFGAISAELALELLHTHSAGKWTFALNDDHGYLINAGYLRTRPRGWARRKARCRATSELIVPAALLDDHSAGQLSAAHPHLAHAWAPVLTAIAATLANERRRPPPDPRRRLADTHLRRHILARTPTCIWPNCTRPARRSEIDHARDHAKGGPTDHINQWPMSADHHALKTRHGWTIEITGPHTYNLTSHLGTVHPVTIAPTWRPLPGTRTDWRYLLRSFMGAA